MQNKQAVRERTNRTISSAASDILPGGTRSKHVHEIHVEFVLVLPWGERIPLTFLPNGRTPSIESR